MSEREKYIINSNFELIFRRFNRDLIPAMKAFNKFIKKQKRDNNYIKFCLLGVSVYMCLNEIHRRMQEERQDLMEQREIMNLNQELDRLNKKIEQLKRRANNE